MQTVEYRKREAPLPDCLAAALPEKLLHCALSFGGKTIEEIRLYRDRVASLTVGEKNVFTDCLLSGKELEEIFRSLCEGSPYAYRDAILQGSFSPGEGVRIGLCGRAITEGGQVLSLTDLSGLVIRIPHALFVPVDRLLPLWPMGMLVYAPPGVGKTTLLRSLAQRIAETHRTVLIDRGGEFLGTIPSSGKTQLLHLLTGFPAGLGIEIATRSLGAQCILTDEIGSDEEADAILSSANRGVPLIATAHAKSASELFLRPALGRLLASGVFGYLVGLFREGYGRFSFEISRTKET